jgi:hypothetical protein
MSSYSWQDGMVTKSIEKERSVLYSDFVTILWGASMQYITKLTMVTKSETPVPPPQK